MERARRGLCHALRCRCGLHRKERISNRSASSVTVAYYADGYVRAWHPSTFLWGSRLHGRMSLNGFERWSYSNRQCKSRADGFTRHLRVLAYGWNSGSSLRAIYALRKTAHDFVSPVFLAASQTHRRGNKT
jgi:hypothetical protein